MTFLFRRSVPAAYAILTFTAFLWAGNAIAGKLAAGHISPFLLTTTRWILATAILLPLAQGRLRRDWPIIRANFPFLFACGAIGFASFNNLFYLALNHTTAINVAIEQASMPLIVFGLNFALFGIRASAMQILGFLLTLVGVALTVSNGDFFRLAGQSINVGDLYMLIAVVAYGVYSVALARKPAIHWLSFITVLAASALVTSIPFTIWEFSAGRAQLPDLQGGLVAIYTAVGPAIFAQLCWIRGLDIIGSNRGGVFINLVPIFASLMAIVILGEDFRLYHAIAISLVLGGVWMSQRQHPASAGANS